MDSGSSVVDPRSCISATNTTLVDSPKRSSVSSTSSLHDFQFWSSSAGDLPADLLTADELFVDGVLLPLRLLTLHRSEPATVTTRTEPAEAQLESAPAVLTTLPEPAEAQLGLAQAPDIAAVEVAGDQPPPCSSSSSSSACAGPAISASISCAPTTASKRWKDIFKVGEKKGPLTAAEAEKKRKKSVRGGTAPEEQHLNINIWPFARSRSAGNNASGGRRKSATISGRKVSSAPCSRSNSRGESSKSTTAGGRRWAGAASPGRGGGGVHVGRMSPVWQIRRPDQRKDKASGAGGRTGGSSDGVGVRVLNLNVNTCIGYRSQGSCRSEDRDGAAGVARTGAAVGGGGGSGGGGGLFSPLRTLFSKKVVY